MSSEQFLEYANLFPEALVLVSADGAVLAFNRGASLRLGLIPTVPQKSLYDCVYGSPESVRQYLLACSRTRGPVPGSLNVVGPDGMQVPCRAEGALVRPRRDDAPALVQLRLTPKAEAPSQFAILNQRIGELTKEIAARKRIEAEMENLNRRLRRTMAETHHRVKNNLQVISSLIGMQTMQHEEFVPVAELHRLTQHICALANIHDLLTHQARVDPDMANVSVRKALEVLVSTLRISAGERPIRAEFMEASLPIRLVTSLAVLVNELVSNAIKHGAGTIGISFSVDRTRALVRVSDEGPGFPADFDATTSANTGLELIETLTRWDLRGTSHFYNRPECGACIDIEFSMVGADGDGDTT